MTLPPAQPPGGGESTARLGNGLVAARYVPLTDIEPEVGRSLLTALARARIAAFLTATPDRTEVRRLFVSAEERADARTIVAAVVRAAGGTPAALPDAEVPDLDVDSAFADMIADWKVDTIAAIREAERALSREDENWRARLEQAAPEPWLDEHHYVPPAPPPLPRFATQTVAAMSLLAISILVLGLGGRVGLASRLTLLLGVCGILVAAVMLFLRLRKHREDDDNGAVL
ncbi:MAG: hypothetical protein EPN43_02940 [Jatrophihabitans sp.]|nr:MAG: hypothetical protein EPN43_02940 [Jatrophihabitans sp.]